MRYIVFYLLLFGFTPVAYPDAAPGAVAKPAMPVPPPAPAAPAATTPCNGYPELCNRRYNEICYVNAHNGSSNTPSPVQDQDLSLTQQMNMGIRATKLPIHLDYANPLGYYHQLILAYIDLLRDRRNQIAAATAQVTQKPSQKITDAENQVASLNNQINDMTRQINDTQNWYNHLNDFDKAIQAIPYAAKMGGFETAKLALQASLATAEGVLEAAKKEVQIAPLALDPRLTALDDEITLVDQIRKSIIDAGGPSAFNQTLFACHGLYKAELYSDHISSLLGSVPATLKPILAPIFDKLKSEIPNLMTKLLGNVSQSGGIIPFTPCLIDASAKQLTVVLGEIKAFLDTHPNEIFSLSLEDATGGKYSMYTDAFNQSGIMHYTHTQNQWAAWPTLGDMIKSGKRLVVFIQGNGDPNYPWLNAAGYFFAWSNRWEYTAVNDLVNSDPHSTIKNPDVRDNTPPFNKLFDIPHQVTPGFAGDKKMATIVNARAVLEPRLLTHMQIVNHIVNSFSVDFFEYPSTNGVPDVIDVANHVNGVGKWAGKPLWKPSKDTSGKSTIEAAQQTAQSQVLQTGVQTAIQAVPTKIKSTF